MKISEPERSASQKESGPDWLFYYVLIFQALLLGIFIFLMHKVLS
jgi:hypothetical protein